LTVRVEIVAVGTELLLGQIPDTNSQWLGERLTANGIASHYHQHVGDNHERIVSAVRVALSRSDAVIVCGGLGPTQDDITRAALAEVMGVTLVRHDEIIAKIRTFFEARGRTMSENNLLQADVPDGATIIEQVRGTAPGLMCPLGDQVMYAVPGVPYEMSDMFERALGQVSVIVSRVLRTWGASESGLAEAVAERFDALIDSDRVTIAFLASGIEGIKVRITARGNDRDHALSLLDEEEQLVRALIASAYGDIVFGIDDETMEFAISQRLLARGWTLGLAESLTGGLIASRLVNVPGASTWFRGGLVSYASDVKFELLHVTPGPVVGASAAEEMARGAKVLLKVDVALAITGVAGPDEQDGHQPGTVFVGLAIGDEVSHVQLRVPGDRSRVRSFSAIGALDALRRGLDRLD
jgi:nicotinamide-nucleotide amidase